MSVMMEMESSKYHKLKHAEKPLPQGTVNVHVHASLSGFSLQIVTNVFTFFEGTR